MQAVFDRIIPWFRANGRDLPFRAGRDPYRVWLSEIMLQQTRIEAAIPYYYRFIKALPTVAALAACPEEKLLKLWEGLGYYSRARNLRKAAVIMTERYGAALPPDYEALLSLPGVGEYTAGAIASIAFGLPEPAVDGNVLRVVARITGDERDVLDPRTRKDVREKLKARYPTGAAAGDLTEGLMELGEMICIPGAAPRCEACPVREMCRAEKEKSFDRIPYRAPAREKKTVPLTVFLLRCGDRFALRRRAEPGLLHGMFEFPNLPGALSPKEAELALREKGLAPLSLVPAKPGRHVFTHLIWEMTGYFASLPDPDPAFLWATPAELAARFPLPTAFRPFLKQIQ